MNFCDGQDAVNPGCRELHFVAGVQILGRAAIFYLVLVDKGRCTGCADGSGRRMSKSDRAIDVIELGDLALALTFLSQSPPTDDGDGRRARQTDLRKCHDDLQILVASNNLATGRLVPDLGAAARGRALPLGAPGRGASSRRRASPPEME